MCKVAGKLNKKNNGGIVMEDKYTAKRDKLIAEYKRLQDRANMLLEKHDSFRSYCRTLDEMNRIGDTLYEAFDIDVDKL